MRSFDYTSATTLDDVISTLGQTGNGLTRPLAGGTDLLTLMKADIVQPARLIDIKRVPELASGIAASGDGITLGALTTLTEIETSALLQERAPVLTQAAALAATPQLRNMATIAGNLLQRPRCWYYRDEHFQCWLKGGDTCHARDGENQQHAIYRADVSPCVAVHPSDLASALVALDAEVRVRGQGGERTLPLTEFFAPPTDDRRMENVLGDDEIVVSIRIPDADNTRSTYLKAMDRKTWAFALVGVAAVVRQAGGQIEDARIVLSGVAPTPWRVRAAKQALIGSTGDASAIDRAVEAAVAEAQPLEHNGYKLALAKSLIGNALRAVTGDG